MADRMSDSMFRVLSRFPKYISGLAIAFGLMVLTGWAFHIQRLKGMIPGQVAVKANAACFVLIGLALWLAISGGRRRLTSVASRLLALLASFIGLLSFLEYCKGWDLGIDQLLFTAGPDDLPGSVRLALMSPIAAANFFLLGISIAVLNIKGRPGRVLENLLPTIAAVTAIFGILDFVLDPQSTHTHIAPMTALILFVLSFAVLVARAESGLGALFLSRTAGGMLCRRLLPSAILIPIAIAWLRWKGQHTGLYSDWTGLAIMTVTSAVLLAGLTVWTAFVLDRADADRSKAEESARSLATIVTCTNDAIIGKTLDGIVTSWNPGAEAIYGYSAEEMIGQSVTRIVPPDLFSEFQKFLRTLRSGDLIRHHETERITKDGKRIPVAISISPTKDEKGKIVGASTIARDISDRRRAEQALANERRRFEAVLDHLPVMVCLLRPDYSVAFANRSFRKQFGESKGRKCYEFCFGQTAPCQFCQTFNVLKKGQPIDWEVVTKEGRIIHAFDFPFTDADGSPLVLEMAIDVTDQKEAERKIQESSRYTRSLIEASMDPLVTISKLGKITDVNQATETATGVSRDRLIGSDFCDYFTEPEKAREGYQQVFEKGFIRDYALAIRCVSGAVMDVLYNATVFKGENGEVEGVFAAARDITERKQAEDKVLEASRYTRSLIEASLDPLVTISADGKITDVNQATENATGFSRDRLIGSDFSTYFTEPEKARQGYRQVFSSGLVRDYPLTLRQTSGSTMEVLYNATVFRNARGEVEGVFAAARDVTDLKRTEQELRLSRERLALALKAGHSGTFDWDMQNNVNRWTPEVEEVHGLAPGEFGGTFEDWEAVVLPEDLPAVKVCIETSLKTGEFAGEWRIRRHNDGQVRWITARAKILNDYHGKPWRMIGVNMDVTERKQAEEEVRKLNDELELRVIQRTAELEAANKELEAFTYSVSHDLRAPLRHISGFSKMLSEEFSASLPPDAQHHLQRIQEGTRRMGQLVDDLLNLGRVGRKELSLQVAGLRSIIDGVIESLKSDVGDRQVEWKIGDLPYVECDTTLIQQVFQNLLSNALKFTRPRAKAVIEIGQEQRDGSPVVYVRDNGVGFSMKYADKLFGVFQRLHRAEDFEGTGVGLATVQRIVQKHGGRIWAEAELDKGANFYFTLGGSQSSEANSKAVAAGEKS